MGGYSWMIINNPHKLLLSAYHPRQRKMTREKYVNTIISVLQYNYPR